ncbi:MAG: alpha-L-fucosidase [Opitutales bacterium]
MKVYNRPVLGAACSLLSILSLITQSIFADPYEAINDPRMEWYMAAKFGLMIHWGIYAEPAGMWSEEGGSYESWKQAQKDGMLQVFGGYAEQIQKNAQIRREEYKKIANDFDWSDFNAQDIIDLCYATGQRYIVITAKHHDGFAMYDSKADPFNIADATPYGRESGRDPLRELAEACHATKTTGPWEIKMCFYYSHCIDWMEDGGNTHSYKHALGVDREKFQEYFERKMFPQVKELMTEYGEVGLIWFDVPRVPFSDEQAEKIVNMMREAQPNTLVNGRLGKQQFVDYLVSGDNGAAGVPTDYYWETPASINHTYGYGTADKDWKNWEELAEIMVKVIAHNGNYLLNIGPRSDGSIPEESLEILHDLGKWVKLNSEAIFDTEATPYRGESMTTHDWGTCTQRENTLYLFVKHWPEDGKIKLPLIRNRIKQVSFLALADKAKFKHSRSVDSRGNTVVTLEVPKSSPIEAGIPVIKVVLEGEVELDTIKHTYDLAKKQIFLDGKDFHAKTGNKTMIYYDREIGAVHKFLGNDAPTWVFDVPESGEYVLEIFASAHRNLARDKKNEVHINGEPILYFTTQTTPAGAGKDDWKNFQPHEIGTVTLEKGRNEIAIVRAPRQKGWNLSIKHMTLTKAQ